ncbi:MULTISPECIES: DUF930 domain-containing protein [Agrobacterium]|uniref:DUF930 domain-containing protein n=1 Tax=Agrobacterium TaxID=357 RepID=UPI002157EB0B|nr:DUF930 domain-containing protein [Agrobacterium fabrum]MCR6723861.1 DUF930 domain-containing protein [Agrobacterium fabrum]
MMEKSSRRNPGVGWGSVAVSLMLHLAAVIAFAPLLIKKTLPPPLEQSIAVEILREPSTTRPSSVPQKEVIPDLPSTLVETQGVVEASKVAPEPDVMVRPKELFSAKLLADPRSKAALVALRQLTTDDRVIQLCNVEAMEQVYRWNPSFQPDFVVAYAMKDTKLSGLTLLANGAALRSKQHWYNIRFRCDVTPDLETVVSFEFSVGAEIPENEWAAHSLPAGDGASD